MELWAARDESGKLGLYRKKPVYLKKGAKGDWYGAFGCYIWDDNLPELTFENSPKQIKIELL